MRASLASLALLIVGACGGARGPVLHPRDAGLPGLDGDRPPVGSTGGSVSDVDGWGGFGTGGVAGASGLDGGGGSGLGGVAAGGSGGTAGAAGADADGSVDGGQTSSSSYRSPYAVAYSRDSALLAVSDATAGELVLVDAKAGTSLRSVKLAGQPKGLAWSGAGKVLVAEYGAGTLAEVDTVAGTVLRRLDVGPKPTDVALDSDGAKALVPDFALHRVSILDVASGKLQFSVDVAPYPFAIASSVGNTAVVTHLVASGDATKADAAAGVTLLDISSGTVSATINLPAGSTAVRGVHCSPDGKWAYVVHAMARLNVPVTDSRRGRVYTHALSIIDIANKSLYATTLLDRISEGAADPWGVDLSADGKTLWVSLAGSHQVLRVDLAMLHKLLAGPIPSELVRTDGGVPTALDRNKDAYTRPLSDVWFEIAADPAKRAVLADDLGALYSAGLLQVIRLAPAQGPRGIAASADGKQVAVAIYFAGQVGLVNVSQGRAETFVAVGTQPDESWARQGERMFHDASRSVQGWLSCSSCHPDGRSDGLAWDMSGSLRNTQSLLYAPNAPLPMAHGVRGPVAAAVTSAVKNLQLVLPDRSSEAGLGVYLNSLAAEPYGRAGATTSMAAQRGAAVFTKAACDTCHVGRYMTDLKAHDVGTKGARDLSSDSAEIATPSLADLWRSAPYLHDGSAATLKDVLTSKNVSDQHGKTSALTAQEIDDLVEYMLEMEPPAPEKADVFALPSTLPAKVPFQGVNPGDLKFGFNLSDPKLAVLDKILFIKRDYLPTSDASKGAAIVDQFFGFNASKPGGLFVLEDVLSGAPTTRNLLANSTCANGPHQGKKLEGGGFLSPDLHFDGKQIVFAYTDIGQFQSWDESSTFHIFKVNADGTGLTQLTQGNHNDVDPTWLPDGRIAFVSDRRGGYGRKFPRPVPVHTLFIMNADGTGMEPLSYHESHEWQPSIDHNGLLVYTRWDWMDRGSQQAHHAWLTTPDGLDARAMVGNYSVHATVTPRALMNLREIPGSNKLVGTAAALNQQSYGSIVVVDPDIEDDDGMGPYTVITRDAGFPQATVSVDADHKYATAWPIDEHRFLVVHDPDSNAHGVTGKRFGIYLIDDEGNKQLLYKDATQSCLDPMPLAVRPVPLVLATARVGKSGDSTEVRLLNVYDSMQPMPAGTEIKALRVVQVYPKSTPLAVNPRLGHGAVLYNDQNGRGSLGTVPVEKDGSAHFFLPPGKPVYFQALDASGTVVQSMRSSTYAVPGTAQITCQGCHERRYGAPKPRAEIPLAFGRGGSTLQPEADGSNPISFARLVQPILDKHCVSCHGTAKPGDLSKGDYETDADRFYTSYKNLKPYLSYYAAAYDFGPPRSTPGKLGARISGLYPLLKGGHQGVVLSDGELRAIALWLDLNSDMYSDDIKRDAQSRGEAVTPSIE